MSAGFVALTMVMATMLQSDARVLPSNAMERKYVNNVGIDNYEFEFQTPDGIFRKEKGYFSNGVWTVEGKVTWIAYDGKIYSYSYVADDNGYKQAEVLSSSMRPEPVFTTPTPPVYYYKPSQGAAHRPQQEPVITCGTKAALLGCGK